MKAHFAKYKLVYAVGIGALILGIGFARFIPKLLKKGVAKIPGADVAA